MRRVLVTGATGFLGKRLCLALKDAGYAVTGIGRNVAVGKVLEENGIKFIEFDLALRDDHNQVFSGFDCVIHCAALSSPWGSAKDFYAANVVATAKTVAACVVNKVGRLIHISSSSIYFDYQDRFDIREDARLPGRFANHYAHSKYMAEAIVSKANAEGLDTIILRPRGIFGPQDPSILPRIIDVLQLGKFPFFRNGECAVDMTHVDNVTHAVKLCLMAASSCSGKAYNISNGEPRRIKDLVRIIADGLGLKYRARNLHFPIVRLLTKITELFCTMLGRSPRHTAYTLGLLAFSQTLDISAAKAELGYVPQVSMDDGLGQFIVWWKNRCLP